MYESMSNALADELPVAPDAVNYRYGFLEEVKVSGTYLDCVERGRPFGEDAWCGRVARELGLQRRQTMVPDTFSSPPFLPTVCDIFDFLCFQNAFVGGCP